jgi:hypothetical protein
MNVPTMPQFISHPRDESATCAQLQRTPHGKWRRITEMEMLSLVILVCVMEPLENACNFYRLLNGIHT